MAQYDSGIIEQQAELLQGAPKALREKIDWVVDWCKKDAKNAILGRFELGEQVQEVLDDHERNGCKRYGSRAFAALSLFSGEAESSLRTCARLAKLYLRKQIEDICEMVMADGVTPLSYSHIRAIIALDNEKDRMMAINKTLENCWSADALSKYVVELRGGSTSKNPQGRPVAKPKELDGVISQQLHFANDFEKRNLNVWKSPQHSITAHLQSIPKAQYTDGLANQLEELSRRMQLVAKEAAARADEAHAKAEEIKKVIREKAGQKIPVS